MSQHLSQTIGYAVRDLRLQAGYTQEAFADKCGFFRTYLSRLETGKANPTINAVEVLAAALNISAARLVAIAENYRVVSIDG